MAEANSTCPALGCEKMRLGKSYCSMHSTRLQRHGVLEMPTSGACKQCGQTFAFKGVRVNSFCTTYCRNAHNWAANSEEHKAKHLLWRTENREAVLAKQRARRHNNPEAVRAQEQIYRDRDREKINQRAALYRAANREAINARVREWGVLNIERKLAHNQARRARKIGNGSFLVTSKDLARMKNRFSNVCGYCSGNFTKSNPMHIEHVLPIVRGGSHSVGNIIPACAACNLSKRDKTVMEWRVWKLRRLAPSSLTA